MSPVAEIVARFDALNTGGLKLSVIRDGDIMAEPFEAMIRHTHSTSSLLGYGATADAAIEDLWSRVAEMDASDLIVVRSGKSDRRYYRWHHAAWQEQPAPENAA